MTISPFNDLGQLDLSLLDPDEIEALAPDVRQRLDTLIEAKRAVEDAELAVKEIDDSIAATMKRREELLRRMPPRPSQSDRHVANAKLEIAKAAARRNAHA